MTSNSDKRTTRSDLAPVEDRMVRSRVLADVLGISERQVAYHAGSGVLPRNEKSLYPLRASIQAYCAHLRGGRGGESGTTLAQEREREVRERADALAMRNAATRRELLPAVEVEAMWGRICRDLRAGFLALPGRFQQRLAHLTAHDLAAIDREIRDTLKELSDDRL